MTPTTAVFFDLDGTLIDDDASSRICMDRTCLEFQACAPGFDRVRIAQTYYGLAKAFWAHRATSGLEDERSYRIALWDEALRTCGILAPGLADEFASFYTRARAITVVPFDDAAPVLEAMQGRYRLAVITNGPGDIQRQKLALAGLDGYFDAAIASTDIGAGKPDGPIFQAAIDAVGADPARAWHVGDNLATDIAGALNAGLSAAWINRHGEVALPEYPVPHAELTSLRELLPLLGKL